MSIKLFGQMLNAINISCRDIGKALAFRLGVPYLEEYESERLIGHCFSETLDQEPKDIFPTRCFKVLATGDVLCQDEFPTPFDAYEQLTEEVWTKNHYPDSYNDVLGALAKVSGGITGVYYHRSQMCLVLVTASGEKVGIRSTSLIGPAGLKNIAELGKVTAAKGVS